MAGLQDLRPSLTAPYDHLSAERQRRTKRERKRGRRESQRDGDREYLLHAVRQTDKSGDGQRHRTDFPSVLRQHLIPHLRLQHIFKSSEQDCAYQTIFGFCTLWNFSHFKYIIYITKETAETAPRQWGCNDV